MDTAFIQDVYDKQLENLEEEEKIKIDFNPLQLYFGEDYIVNDQITIHQPCIQDFVDYGDANIYSTIAPFTCNTTSYRVQLYDMGIDWNKITNQELFAMLIKTINPKYSKLIFGDIDFSCFDLYSKHTEVGEEIVLYDRIHGIEIDDNTREKMCRYIQFMFNSFPPEEEFTSNNVLKQDLINNDRQKQLNQKKKKKSDSNLLSMISFCLNHPGFPYKKDELRKVCIVEFMDSVQRLQIYETTHALYGGMYSGFIDTSKIDKNQFNFMRDVRITA